ncbi:MAG: hypothetical protein QOH28_2100 [Actinomycetota bacterium]|nr:hypothetical protein [Actinomycetota bacterium]
MGGQSWITRFARTSMLSRRTPRLLFAALSTTLVVGQAVVPALVQPASAALSTNFFDYQNHDVATSAAGLVDWANNGALTSSNVVGSTWSRAGSQGLFDGGVYNGSTKPPTAPGLTAAGLALKASGTMDSSAFMADPLSSDSFSCGGATVNGDPTTFAGAGSETNNGQLNTFTYGTSGNNPPKDDVSNVYAISHNTASANEVFFGGERIVNNGSSHIDFEFLQASLNIPNPCAAGTMSGHRTQRDLLLSTDFTNGGALSGYQLYSWSCNGKAPGTAGYDAAKDATICDPAANGNPGSGDPQYVAVSNSVSSFGVNAANITCGGWVCRDGSGTGTPTLLANAFMEGGIDLTAAGFTGCISTFLPHTRSSPSFTSVLKDFAGPVAFSNCKSPTITTSQASAGVTSGANITVGLGASVTDTATLHGAAAHVGGTVEYKLFSDANCTTQVGSTSTKTIDGSSVNGNLVLPTSDAITPLAAGTYYWTATYSGDTASGGQNNGVASACGAEVLTVSPPVIHVNKTADAVSVSAGTPIGFTVTVSNSGLGTAAGVTLTDALPGGNAATPVHWTIDGSTGNPAAFAITGADGSQHLTLAGQPISMASGASLMVHVTAATSSTSCAAYDNTASVTTSNDGSDSHQALETVNCPRIDVNKTPDHQGPVSAGTPIGFTVTVSNPGLGNASGVTLTDALPGGNAGTPVHWTIDGTTGDPSSFAITGADGSQHLTLAGQPISMAAGASLMVHVTAATSSTSCATYDNTATVTTANDGSDHQLATETVDCPHLAIVKTADHEVPVSAGSSIGFKVTVSNPGPGNATDVTLTDALPGGNADTPVHWTIDNSFGDASSFAITGADGSQQLTLVGQPIGMAADTSLTVHLTAATSFTSCATYDNEATIEATNNSVVEPARASETVNCPDLAILKTADASPVSTGDPIGFTVKVSNSGAEGTGTAKAVTLSDPLPAGDGVSWAINPAYADAGTCSISGSAPSQTLNCAFGDMAPGASNSVHIASTTTAASGGTYPNKATATADNHPPVDSSATIVVQPPALSITKVADAAQVTAGDPIGFTINVANSKAAGTGIARSATLSDPLPGHAGVSWSIDPAYAGPGTCSITGSAPNQTLACAFGDLAPGASASVHVTSATTSASVGDYPNTATASTTNGTPVHATATISVIAPSSVVIQGTTTTTSTSTTIAPTPPPPPGPLPFTGSSAGALAALALVLMMAGGTMAMSRRRRRAAQH